MKKILIADECIVKPFSPSSLLRKIEEILA